MTRRIWLVAASVLFLANPVRADDWPQWLGPQRDGVWRETGILEKFPAKPVDQGYSGPAVAQGKVFLTDWVRGKGVKDPKASPPPLTKRPATSSGKNCPPASPATRRR